jgi:hypothetical protein
VKALRARCQGFAVAEGGVRSFRFAYLARLSNGASMAGTAVSTAKVDITPQLSMNPWMGGYGTDDSGGRAATGTHTPLFARCVVFWDSGSPNAIAVADVLAFPRSMHQAIRQRVIALTEQWGPSDFVLAATHTHNGPALTSWTHTLPTASPISPRWSTTATGSRTS